MLERIEKVFDRIEQAGLKLNSIDQRCMRPRITLQTCLNLMYEIKEIQTHQRVWILRESYIYAHAIVRD